MAGPPTNLGYGAPSEATIDQVNIWMRSTPWYQALLRSWGQSPNNVHLNDSQKQQIVKAAQANGVVVNEGAQEIDDSGNFRNQGHKLRNTLIVAGIAAATIATMGAAGVFSGAAGAAGGAGAAGTGAGVAGIEGGVAGLSDATLAALGTGAMGAVPVGAGIAGAAGAGVGAGVGGAVDAGVSGGAFDAAGNFIGPSTVTGEGGMDLGSILDLANKGYSAYKNIAGATAPVLSSAAGAAQKQKNTEDAIKLALANYGLNRDEFALNAPGTRLTTGSRAALSAALAKAGPTHVNWGGPGSGLRGEVPTYTGGIHDAIGGLKDNPDYMNLLDLVGKDTLKGEQTGGATGGGQDAAMPGYLSSVGNSSLIDKILGGGALTSSILAALGTLKKPGGQQPSSGGQTPGQPFDYTQLSGFMGMDDPNGPPPDDQWQWEGIG